MRPVGRRQSGAWRLGPCQTIARRPRQEARGPAGAPLLDRGTAGAACSGADADRRPPAARPYHHASTRHRGRPPRAGAAASPAGGVVRHRRHRGAGQRARCDAPLLVYVPCALSCPVVMCREPDSHSGRSARPRACVAAWDGHDGCAPLLHRCASPPAPSRHAALVGLDRAGTPAGGASPEGCERGRRQTGGGDGSRLWSLAGGDGGDARSGSGSRLGGGSHTAPHRRRLRPRS